MFSGILGILSGFFSKIFGAFGISIQSIYAGLSEDLSSYGIWSIPLLVLILGITGTAVFLILDAVRMADDIT